MNKNRKLKRTDKKIKKKQLQQTKERLSKLSTEQLMDKRRGINPKSESKADYIKRRKSEMSKPSPAKIVPIIAAIGKAAAGAAKIAKGIKAGAALAKGVKAVGTAQKIGKAVGTAKKVIGAAQQAKSFIDRTRPADTGKIVNKGMQKFAAMDFAKSSPNRILIKPPHPLNPKTPNASRASVKNFDAGSAFKMKGFSGFGNEPSPAKLGVAKIAVKAGIKAGKAIKKAYQNYKGTAVDSKLKAATGYARKVDLQKANARLKANKNRR
tara:strand:- start:14 stop:811 length:798 start_codon:yes stop_codon:yes gene_type:complete